MQSYLNQKVQILKMEKLDVKDHRILKELDENADISLRQLAKNVRLSHQVVEYRLKKLINNRVILAISSWIDYGKMGYMLFRVHIRFKTFSKEKRREFENFVIKSHKCFCVGSVLGEWDEYIEIIARMPSDFENEINEIAGKFSDEIEDYETLIINRMHVFSYGYIMEGMKSKNFVSQDTIQEIPIDENDIEILKILSKNSRTPILQIASDIGMSRSAVKERIKKLHEKEIISGNRMLINFKKMGKESYKIFFKMKSNETERKRFIEFARVHPNIIYAFELFGTYQMDIEVQIDNREKLQELLINMRTMFPIINDYSVMSVLDNEGINFYPMEIL